MKEETKQKAYNALFNAHTCKPNDGVPQHFPKVYAINDRIYFTFKAAMRAKNWMIFFGYITSKKRIHEVTFEEAFEARNGRPITFDEYRRIVDTRVDQIGDGVVCGMELKAKVEKRYFEKKEGVKLL